MVTQRVRGVKVCLPCSEFEWRSYERGAFRSHFAVESNVIVRSWTPDAVHRFGRDDKVVSSCRVGGCGVGAVLEVAGLVPCWRLRGWCCVGGCGVGACGVIAMGD